VSSTSCCWASARVLRCACIAALASPYAPIAPHHTAPHHTTPHQPTPDHTTPHLTTPAHTTPHPAAPPAACSRACTPACPHLPSHALPAPVGALRLPMPREWGRCARARARAERRAGGRACMGGSRQHLHPPTCAVARGAHTHTLCSPSAHPGGVDLGAGDLQRGQLQQGSPPHPPPFCAARAPAGAARWAVWHSRVSVCVCVHGCVRGVRACVELRPPARQTTRNGAWGVAWAYVGQSAWRGCRCVRLDQLHAVVSLRSAWAHCTEHNRHSQGSLSRGDSAPKGGPEGAWCPREKEWEPPEPPKPTEPRTQKGRGPRGAARPSAPQNTEHRTEKTNGHAWMVLVWCLPPVAAQHWLRARHAHPACQRYKRPQGGLASRGVALHEGRPH